MARLDLELTQRGLCKSRSQALLSIKEKNVLLNGNLCLKPNKEIKPTDIVSLVAVPKYVSRGGDKLAAALSQFSVSSLADKNALDIGSSTGGFTDCLLQAGAASVVAIDVGTMQFDEDLRKDPRILLKEKTDIRALTSIPKRVDIIVIDVSFISLTHIVPTLSKFVVPGGEVIALVKPQFEVGRGNVNRQGLVTDTSLYDTVLETVSKSFKQNGWSVEDTMESPIIGGTGNTEFLLHAKHKK